MEPNSGASNPRRYEDRGCSDVRIGVQVLRASHE
jgi:hypothetical protein